MSRTPGHKRRVALAALPLIAALMAVAPMLSARPAVAADHQRLPGITTPEEFFGHQLGADFKLARWDRIVEYFAQLEQESDRLQVVDLGPSTEGHPFLLVVMSSPANLSRLEELRQINLKLHDPDTPEDEVDELLASGKAVVSQSYGLHSTEVAGAQTAPEVAYDLASRTDPDAERILDETILLLFPNFNPDGQVMITDWYRETVGTEYEGVSLPWLYHRYAGHDNNRDGDYLNLQESRYIARILYRDWKPHAYVDHHQMGSYGARLYVPPYSEPIRPHADPLIWREIAWYGAHVALALEAEEVPGVLNAGIYPGWGHFGWHWITPFHNIAGMLTESASASLASPLFIHPEQLEGGARGFPEYEAQSTMPRPWPGGWWRQRDIVEQQKIASFALLDLAARNRESTLRSSWLQAKRQTERGAAETPRAFVVPASQHDPITAAGMIHTLRLSDVEVVRATRDFVVDDRRYPAGSWVVTAAQPKRGLVMNLLGRTRYPDNEWTRGRDGRPLRPYDTSTHTMAELMGVEVVAVDTDPSAGADSAAFAAVPVDSAPAGTPTDSAMARLDGRHNASFAAVQRLLESGVTVHRVTSADPRREPAPGSSGPLRPGDFLVSGLGDGQSASVAAATGAVFEPWTQPRPAGAEPLRRLRVGLFQRYRGGSMDEGWTRLVLEQHAIPYSTIRDAEITSGELGEQIDVLILPHDSPQAIKPEEPDEDDRPPTPYPDEYRSGLDEDGLAALRSFVEGGGSLVALGDATELAIEAFTLDVRNVVDGLDQADFFSPGSTLRAIVDTGHPLAWGMPEEALVLHWFNPAFEIVPSRHNDRYQTVVRYPRSEILESGWLIGEQHLANRAAMVTARLGEGRVVLIGFRPQHRAQTDGTFKLLFNALVATD